MVLQVKMHGTGKANDPYRVNLPTYQLIIGNIAAMTALVHVDDADLGVAPEDYANEQLTPTTNGVQVKTLSPVNAGKIQVSLDTAYAAPAGTYAVELM